MEDDAAMTHAAAATDTVLDIAGLQLLRGTRTILSGIHLRVSRGEIVALMGPSGSGKTTILRAVAGLERFQTGTIDIDGVMLAGGADTPKPALLRELRRKVGMVFQFHCLFEHLSAIENVCLAPVHAHGVAPEAARDARARAAARVRRRASRGGAAAAPVRRRSAARRHRAGAGGRSAACC